MSGKQPVPLDEAALDAIAGGAKGTDVAMESIDLVRAPKSGALMEGEGIFIKPGVPRPR